jgi:hypothetical protein
MGDGIVFGFITVSVWVINFICFKVVCFLSRGWKKF